ncbi:hypothetical protein [Thermosulfurimonas dismutans]|uniref:Capsular polysaccharide export system inner membrane protein KpsE n=1 Tax=Thermosulfurimonas dismutans TaxID=999894 RepID=A0A179D1B5_9BACT|nr:hypothetical protein [Thermosulfurimonas dismutans]OAQ19855.1 hypothetical protein TDIS_2035 [Thermosulfurimonas dismutans]
MQFFKKHFFFLMVVVCPTLLTIIYEAFIVTPVYISESKVIVKSLHDQQGFQGFGTFLQSIGVLSPSFVGASLVMNYMSSRTAMFELEKILNLKKYFSRKDIDFIQRFDPFHIDPSYENFFEYYQKKIVNIGIDINSSILIIKVRAFDPEFAYNVNTNLIKLSENFINRLNERASTTAIKFYEAKLEESRKKVQHFSEKLAEFLSQTKVVAPERQIGILLEHTAKLQEQLILKQMELSRIISVTPDNPKIATLKKDIEEIKREINKNINIIAGDKKSVASYSIKLELMRAELEMLQKELEANLTAFIQAQNQALLQHLFIEKVEEPTKPDAPKEPKRIKSILTVFAISFAIWGIISLFAAGVKEHLGK